MKKILLTLILTLFAIPAFALQVGQVAPDFESIDSESKVFRLADTKGQIVILEWYSVECPFSKAHYDAGAMQALQKYAKEKNAIWVTVNSSAPGKQGYLTRQESRDWVRKQNSAAAHVILDPEGEIGHKFGAKTTPHMFVIDQEGKIAYMGALDDKPDAKGAYEMAHADNYVYDAVQALLAGGKPAVQVTKPYGCSIKYAD